MRMQNRCQADRRSASGFALRGENRHTGLQLTAFGNYLLQIHNAQDKKSEANYSAKDQVSGKVGFSIISWCHHRYYASNDGKGN